MSIYLDRQAIGLNIVRIDMDWLKTIEQLAPTIASALGTPVAGMAVSALESALGMKSEDIQKNIEDSKLTAEQVASIQQAEIALKAKAQELGLNFEQMAVQDRKSARDLQQSTHSFIPPVLAVLVTIGFFGILVGLMMETFKTSDALLLMLGSLGTAWTAIMSFYFGSSAGSQAKDAMLHNSQPTK